MCIPSLAATVLLQQFRCLENKSGCSLLVAATEKLQVRALIQSSVVYPRPTLVGQLKLQVCAYPLTKQDAVIVWGGIRDISRNESQKGLRQLRNFVEKHNQTNVLVVNVPNRFDLEAQSCINHEVNTFNRKLDKHMKTFQHASTVEVTSNRAFY